MFAFLVNALRAGTFSAQWFSALMTDHVSHRENTQPCVLISGKPSKQSKKGQFVVLYDLCVLGLGTKNSFQIRTGKKIPETRF